MESKPYQAVIVKQAELDIEETLAYITEELKNPTAAKNLFNQIMGVIDTISWFPYSMPTIKNEKVTLGKEYRRAFVENFVLIYKIVEDLHQVRIMAVMYASSDVIFRLLQRI